MEMLILFYTYSGNSKKTAEIIAKKRNATIYEVKETAKPRTLKAYSIGCFKALRGKSSPIEPISADLAKYDRLILVGPIWAGNPAPAFNAILDTIPPHKKVEVVMVSGSGKSKCKDKIAAKIKSKGSVLTSFKNVKGNAKSK
ncbi:hypothetical protein LQZ18_14115 [Lachnospiraceae bacterium ZAX-1]